MAFNKLNKRLVVPYFLLVVIACEKVPLIEDYGSFNINAMHWFENEKTAYFFIKFNEKLERFSNPKLQLKYVTINKEKTTSLHDFTDIDFTKSVHNHSIRECGNNAVCISHSFKSDEEILSASFRLKYDSESDLNISTDLTVSNHFNTNKPSSFSALSYGVFDKTNEFIQFRIHDNFGIPSNEEVKQFGFIRKFKVSNASLTKIDISEILKSKNLLSSNIHFPAEFCSSKSDTNISEFIFSGTNKWFDKPFDQEEVVSGVCYSIEMLDKKDKVVLESTTAYAFRNPQLSTPDIIYKSPLKEVTKLNLVIKICDNDTSKNSMFNSDFFNYQRFILNFELDELEFCFNINNIKDFKANLKNNLNLLISQIRDSIVNSNTINDFMFVVLFHENFSTEFNKFAEILSNEIYELVQSEKEFQSPRLIGGFVYASTSKYVPEAKTRNSVLWCPQNLKLLENSKNENTTVNCTITKPENIDLNIINFIAPLGAFPDLKGYTNYVSEFGDKGLANSPLLKFYSVPQTINSITENNSTVTYFDSQRLTISKNESYKICDDKLHGNFDSFRFKSVNSTAQDSGLSLLKFRYKLLNVQNSDEIKIGVKWDYFFWGGVNYNSNATVKIYNIIPFNIETSNYEDLADPKWQSEEWDFGSILQKCTLYCNNPIFDEAGKYQNSKFWSASSSSHCIKPVYPEIEGI